MKKKNKKGYLDGGLISLGVSAATDLIGNAVNAANYQFDPNAAPYKIDPMQAFKTGFGFLGMIPEFIKKNKDTKQRANYVMSATPGNYQSGGFINAENVKRFDKDKLKAVQVDLKARGLYTGKIDGIYGPLTEKALLGYNDKITLDRSLPEATVRALSKQTEAQIKRNKELGNFPSKYAIVNDATNTMHLMNPDHTIDKSIPIVTGRDAGDVNTAQTSQQWLKENKGKTFEDYIKYLSDNNLKVTPSGTYYIGKKDPSPSSPVGLKGILKQEA